MGLLGPLFGLGHRLNFVHYGYIIICVNLVDWYYLIFWCRWHGHITRIRGSVSTSIIEQPKVVLGGFDLIWRGTIFLHGMHGARGTWFDAKVFIDIRVERRQLINACVGFGNLESTHFVELPLFTVVIRE